jgi:hypothetical protein
MNELRMALNQGRPIGNHRSSDRIETVAGQRRELRKHGRPRKWDETDTPMESAQAVLQLN